MIDEIVNNKLKELIEKGEVDKIVEDQLKKAINGIIENTVRRYGEVGKALEKKISETLMSGIDKLDFVMYRTAVLEVIQKQLNGTFLEHAVKPVEKMVSEFMDVLEKKEWNLSEIIEKFIEMEVISDKDPHESGEISLVVKQSDHGTAWIGFDEDEGKDKDYNCKYRIAVHLNKNDNKLWYFSIDDKPVSPSKTSSIHGFEEFLFKLYANGVSVIIDECDTSWSTYD